MYSLNGKNIKFSQNDFLAKGGQGSIYVKGSTVYKIYADPSEMITKNKIEELSAITDKRVIVPKDMILDKNGINVGFTMNYTKDTIPLIKLFNTGYREKISFDEKHTIKLIEDMQYTIQHIHDKNVLQVDGNELNYLVDKHKVPYFIDVDSYQTKHHKATVLMPSIRDWQAKQFSKLTDWYSFGIVACQLFIGLHPYKGRHPKYQRDLKQRALDNVSIFNKDVSVPKAVRDFGNIPTEYMKWFNDMFENGKRIPPPLVAGTLSIKPTVTVIVDSNVLKIKELTNLQYNYGTNFIIPSWNKKKLEVKIINGIVNIIEDGKLIFDELYGEDFTLQNNNIYVKNNDKLHEISLFNFNQKTIAKYTSWSISAKASKVFDGFVYQRLLNSTLLSIPYESGKMSQLLVNELNDYNIIDGKYENRVAVLIGLNSKTKKYDKITLIFDKDHIKYKVSIVEDSDYYINFTVLETGVVIEICEDGKLSIFLNNLNKYAIKEIKDKAISTDWKLAHCGSKALFYKDKKVFELKM